MEGFKAKGSFGIPENVKQQMETARARAPEAAKAPEAVQARSAPEVEAPEQEKKSSGQDQLEELKKVYETTYKIQLTEDDVRDYIFKGRLIKKDVEIAPGYLKGTFYSHTPAEYAEVDKHMAAFMKAGDFTSEGASNEKAIVVLSYSWRDAAPIEGDVVGSYRSLGATPQDRRKAICEMGAHIIDLASEANTALNFLLKYALREKGFVKKS